MGGWWGEEGEGSVKGGREESRGGVTRREGGPEGREGAETSKEKGVRREEVERRGRPEPRGSSDADLGDQGVLGAQEPAAQVQGERRGGPRCGGGDPSRRRATSRQSPAPCSMHAQGPRVFGCVRARGEET